MQSRKFPFVALALTGSAPLILRGNGFCSPFDQICVDDLFCEFLH
jgi:hypothetical protein